MMINPWMNTVIKSGRNFAKIDELDIDNFEQKYPHILQLSEYPEPFVGNHNANIYLLNGNPGEEAHKGKSISPAEIKAIEESNHLLATDFFYFDKTKSSVEGYNWWISHTKQLIEELNKTKIKSFPIDKNGYYIVPSGYRMPNIFNIEYFPYHSTKIGPISRAKLKSFDFTNEIVKQGMEKGKLFVILRMKKEWENRIPQLKTYPNVLILSSPQNIRLTANNVLPYGVVSPGTLDEKKQAWTRLLNAL